MTKQLDDLEAVRKITEALKDFPKEDQERIIRWVREKVGLDQVHAEPTFRDPVHDKADPATRQDTPRDIKSFVDSKSPKSGNQFAATVAYFFEFVALNGKKKPELGGEDLQEACRLVGRDRLKNPLKTLQNAHSQGYLDRGAEAGKFKINTVGENLVAMTLPGGEQRKASNTPRKASPKKTSRKTSPRKKR